MNKALMILPYKAGAIDLTEEQAHLLFTEKNISDGERKGELKTIGPWQMPVSYQALCTSNWFGRDEYPVVHGPLHVFGYRTLTNIRQSGYELEGMVSVNGKKVRGFTSSQLFSLPDGRLINVATIHAVGVVEKPIEQAA